MRGSAVMLLALMASCGGQATAYSGSSKTGDDSLADATASLADGTPNGDETAHTGICEGGCLCWTFDACPVELGCYPSQTALRNGALDAFCGSGIVECNASGTAWSIGTPMDSCRSGETAVDVDGGPAGAVCCATETGEPDDDSGSDASGCPAGENLCIMTCNGNAACVAGECPPVGPCPGPPPPLPPPPPSDASTSDESDTSDASEGSDAACPEGEALCYEGCAPGGEPRCTELSNLGLCPPVPPCP